MASGSPQYASSSIRGGLLVVDILQPEIREASQAYACRDEMIKLIDPTTNRDVVIDLGRVQYIGSVGLVALLGVRRHLDGGRIVLCDMKPAVHDIFFISRLIPRTESETAPFEAAPTREAALQALTP